MKDSVADEEAEDDETKHDDHAVGVDLARSYCHLPRLLKDQLSWIINSLDLGVGERTLTGRERTSASYDRWDLRRIALAILGSSAVAHLPIEHRLCMLCSSSTFNSCSMSSTSSSSSSPSTLGLPSPHVKKPRQLFCFTKQHDISHTWPLMASPPSPGSHRISTRTATGMMVMASRELGLCRALLLAGLGWAPTTQKGGESSAGVSRSRT
ncbi:hypothetical protein BHE74_00005672 [Ensete ventricosum]|nr:hypothetical protein BHE74_00005672 [Ensete ventricosum]